MSLQNIFKKEEADSNCIRVPNDFGSWQDEILKQVYKKVPETTKHLIRVDFKKKDDEKGYAVGSAIISQKDIGLNATIPLVIKEFKLFPLDVFIVNGAFLPFNEYNFNKYFLSKNIFSAVVPRQDYDMAAPHGLNDFYSKTHPPFHTKQGSVLDNIKETLETKDIKDFKQSLLKNADSFAAFNANEKIASKIKAICSYKPEYIEKTASFDRDVLCMERYAFNKFKVLSNDHDNFDPKHEVWDYEMIKKAGLDDKVITDGYFYKSASKTVPFVEEDVSKSSIFNPNFINTLGTYNVKSDSGTTYKGSVIPFVMDFNQKRINMKLFISGDNYAYQKDIVGIKEDEPVKLDNGNIEPGATGSFVYEQDGKVIATVPFIVESISKDENSAVFDIWGRTEFGGALKFEMVPNIKQIVSAPTISKNIKSYMIPFNMKFVNLGREISLVSTPSVYKGFEKSAHFGGETLRIIDNGGTYSFKNRNLEKYAYVNGVNLDMSLLNPFEAKFMLMSLGCDNESSENMLKVANDLGSCRVHGLKYPKTNSEMEKDASAKNDKYMELFNHINDMKADLVKEAGAIMFSKDEKGLSSVFVDDKNNSFYKIASELDSTEVVDSVLSLGFINKNNIKKFIEMKQHLELCSSKLAQLLIASRLGVKSIPQRETATAMENLTYVIEGIDLLEGNA